MRAILIFIRSVLHTLVMAVTVPFFGLAIVLSAPFNSGLARYRIARAWLRICVSSGRWLVGIESRIHGLENLPTVGAGASTTEGSAVLLVKHQSTWETFLMPVIMPNDLAYVFKRELVFIPFFGWGIALTDMIQIDRSKRADAFKKMEAQGKRLLSEGRWVIVFPEGTRTPRGQVGTYKTGGTRLACALGAPVVPIAVTSARVWPKGSFIKRPGVVDVSIGAPIPSQGREPAELMREVQNWIEAEMQRLDPEAYARTA